MITLSNIPILDVNKKQLKSALNERFLSGMRTILLFANTNFIVKSQVFVSALQQPEVLIVNDGLGVDLAARMIHKKKFTDNLNGTDFVPYYFDSSYKYKIYLVGSTHVDLKTATAHFHALGQDIVGCSDGFMDIKDSNLTEKINASGAEVVLVGMGNPLQEQWILDNFNSLDAKIIVGVGALFVFLSGNIPRAPLWVRKARLEWMFRLLQEPRRLLKRYTIDIIYFLYLCLKHKNVRS